MPQSPIIRDHVNLLKETDVKSYNDMIADLGKIGRVFYFERRVLMQKDKVLGDIKADVWAIFERYLGFTDEDLFNNRVPELPKLETA